MTPGDRIIIDLGPFDPMQHERDLYDKYQGRRGTVTRVLRPDSLAELDLDAGNGHSADFNVSSGFAWLRRDLPPVPTFTSVDQADQWLEKRAHHE